MSADRIRPGSAGANNVPNEPSGDDEEVINDLEVADVADASNLPDEEVVETIASEPELIDEVEEEIPVVVAAPVGTPATEPVVEPIAASATVDSEHNGFFKRLYYGETRFDFVRRRKTWFAISGIVILAGVVSLGTRGLNLGIDFVGGTSWTVASKTTYTSDQVQKAIGSALTGETITFLGNTGTNSYTIDVEAKLAKAQTNAETLNEESVVSAKLAALTHTKATDVSVESVGPSWGSQITHKAVVALIVFFILIALYISIFFEWRMAFAAIIAVLHDILVTVGIYSLAGLEVTPDTVVAFLTILGYSLYDTIVVFDRIRDNTKNLTLRDRLTFSDVVNLSMNQTLARSINTSLVAIMPILAVLVLGAEILGASTLQYFGIALLVGLATGAYSSIFVASPLVAITKEREQRYRVLRERIESRGGGAVLLSAAAMARGELGSAGDRQARARSATTVAQNGRLRPSTSAGADSPSDGASTERARPAPRKRPTTPMSPRPPSSRNRRKGGRR